ncbi:universal stress protein [bacterium]|nr:universal stress protein [bacterium]
MFKHILVPLDGSKMSEAALPVASFLARKFNAQVTLVHVIEKSPPSEVHGQSHLKDAGKAGIYLEEVSQGKLLKGLHVNYHVHAAAVDNIAESITQHSDEFDHDLIVMCTHGRGKALHLMMGSIAQKVISLGSIPVLITHPQKKGEHPLFSCKSILLPLDDDPDHVKALIVAKELATVCEAFIHLAIAIPNYSTLSGRMTVTSRMLPGTTSRMLDMSVGNAEEYFRGILAELHNQGFNADSQVLRGDPANVIVKFTQKNHVDLIILATHGKSGMEAFWAGSVAHKVCSQCRIPLLLLPLK